MSETPPPSEIDRQGVVLNPFGFAGNQASRIRGLGGTDAPFDPSYAFHTSYVYCEPGDVTFTLAFGGLEAEIGNLTIRVHAVSTAPGAAARSIKMISKPLAALAASDSDIQLSIKAKADTLYAVVGLIYGPCDAHAQSLSIFLDNPDEGGGSSGQFGESSFSAFGRDVAVGTSHLLSPDTASLAYPVSQMCTYRQFDEPAYDEWIAAMGVPKQRHRRQWERVYVLQALSVYGMLQPGARGLGFGGGGAPLPAILAARGCAIVATDLAGDGNGGAPSHDRDALRRPDLCPDERFDEAVEFRPIDLSDIPSDLTGFDFCWSDSTPARLGSIRAGLDFIARSVRCLKIGGIAIHTAELNLSSASETIDNEATVLFRRMDFERLAMDLISEGHSVAQFKYDQGNRPLDRHIDQPPYDGDVHLKMALGRFVTTSFGIIIQRGMPI